MSNKRFKHENVESEPIKQEEAPKSVPATLIGLVSSCDKLNVRKTPTTKENNILNTVVVGTMMFIDLEHSTEDFYKVRYDDVEGYVMKDYITLAGE